MPVWGDFYAKSGNAGSGFVAIWNAGFTASDIDPTAGPANGSLDYHILVPDSKTLRLSWPRPRSYWVDGHGLGGLVAADARRKIQPQNFKAACRAAFDGSVRTIELGICTHQSSIAIIHSQYRLALQTNRPGGGCHCRG
jgi:hypothetical protein